MAGRDEQIHMVAGTFAPHEILRATDHLGRETENTAQPISRQTELNRHTGIIRPSCQSPSHSASYLLLLLSCSSLTS